MWPAIIAAGSSLLGGLLSNSANEKQAQDQMDFQERMSSTAHQREVDDLKKAGLNPMLSAKLGGASSPPGAAAHIENALTPAVNSGLAAQQNQVTVENIRAQTEKVRQETNESVSREMLNKSEEFLNTVRVPRLQQDTVTGSFSAAEIAERTRGYVLQRQKVLEEIDQLKRQGKLTEAHELEARSRDVLLQLEVPKAINEAQAESSFFKREISPYLLDVQRGVSSGQGLRRMIRRP